MVLDKKRHYHVNILKTHLIPKRRLNNFKKIHWKSKTRVLVRLLSSYSQFSTDIDGLFSTKIRGSNLIILLIIVSVVFNILFFVFCRLYSYSCNWLSPSSLRDYYFLMSPNKDETDPRIKFWLCSKIKVSLFKVKLYF